MAKVVLAKHQTALVLAKRYWYHFASLIAIVVFMAYSALNRKESRGSHQRLDGFEQRDDANYLRHTLAYYAGDGAPRIDYGAVTITRSPPGTRAYGAAGEKAEQEREHEGADNG